ncbi:MAG: hypothetical protein ACJ748_01250 [Flavisolibacter sp.]
MNSNVILQGCSLEDLLNAFRPIIQEEVSRLLNEKKQSEEQLISPKEACKIFLPAISLSTLNNWTNEGLLPVHYIKGKKLYKKTEILARLTTLKKYNRNGLKVA